MKFNVYPKEGDMLTLELQRFEVKEDGFILYTVADQVSKDRFLSLDNVAAILPEDQSQYKPEYPSGEPITFHIYLKKQSQRLEIIAHSFKIDQPSSIRFYWRAFADSGIEEQENRNIYLALSEVVAVIPSGGLLR
jgi:hypothetical protein